MHRNLDREGYWKFIDTNYPEPVVPLETDAIVDDGNIQIGKKEDRTVDGRIRLL